MGNWKCNEISGFMAAARATLLFTALNSKYSVFSNQSEEKLMKKLEVAQAWQYLQFLT